MPLLLVGTITVVVFVAFSTVATGAWAVRAPCAALGLWLSAIVAAPVGAGTCQDH